MCLILDAAHLQQLESALSSVLMLNLLDSLASGFWMQCRVVMGAFQGEKLRSAGPLMKLSVKLVFLCTLRLKGLLCMTWL